MKEQATEVVEDRINIFLTVDMQTLNKYYNSHDPAPIYKRQLSHQLEEYIRSSVAAAKRFTPIMYVLKCTSELDKEYAKPLMYSIRRHYEQRKAAKLKEFGKFKKRSWALLIVSIIVVLICQGFIPMLMNPDNQILSALHMNLDIFSWVLLWRPIDVLLFSWNPYLKDICLLNKLATAEVIMIENEN